MEFLHAQIEILHLLLVFHDTHVRIFGLYKDFLLVPPKLIEGIEFILVTCLEVAIEF